MREAENFKFSLSLGTTDENKDAKKEKLKKNYSPTLRDVKNFIENREDLTSEVKDKLIKIANKMPHGALRNFMENYKNYLRR